MSRVRASTTLASWMAKWRPGQACGPYPKTRWSGPVVTALEYMLINEKGGGGVGMGLVERSGYLELVFVAGKGTEPFEPGT